MKSKKFVSIISFLLVLGLLIGCSPKYNMQGYVYESYTGEPLSDITVSIADGKSFITDESGYYQFEGITDNPVHVTIDEEIRWSTFEDDVLLEKGDNFRDFFLDSVHPLGIVETDIVEPYSVSYKIQIGNSEEDVLQTAMVEAIPVEQSLHIVGTEIGLDGEEVDLEIIQIGLIGWSLDEYGNWNETIEPGYSLVRFDQIYQDEMLIADVFFKDITMTYEDTEEEVVIDNTPTRVYSVDYLEEDSGFSREMRLYVISEGPYTGNIKKIESYHLQKSQFPYVCIEVLSFDTIEEILPPIITQ